MNCSDSVCQQLMTCKWDVSVASLWCEATWYPEPKRELITYSEPVQSPQREVEFKPQAKQARRPEFLGRDYRADNRLNDRQ